MHYDIQTYDRTEKGYALDIEVTTLIYKKQRTRRKKTDTEKQETLRKKKTERQGCADVNME